MQCFHISSQQIPSFEEIKTCHVERKDGFVFALLSENEWDDILSFFAYTQEKVKDKIQNLRPEQKAPKGPETAAQKDENKQGYTKEALNPIERAAMEYLGEDIYYVSYLDVDREGKEHPVRVFFDAYCLVLIDGGSVSLKRLEQWTQVAWMEKPLDMAYLLAQWILHCYQDRLETIEDKMDQLEWEILTYPKRWQQNEIMKLNRMVIRLKKSLNAHQFVLSRLANLEKGKMRAQWGNLSDEVERQLESVRQSQELVEHLREAYQASLEIRTNEIVKLLTVLATILVPINLLTSFFGMNFEDLPLIRAEHGIWYFCGICGVIVLVASILLRQKKWLK